MVERVVSRAGVAISQPLTRQLKKWGETRLQPLADIRSSLSRRQEMAMPVGTGMQRD